MPARLVDALAAATQSPAAAASPPRACLLAADSPRCLAPRHPLAHSGPLQGHPVSTAQLHRGARSVNATEARSWATSVALVSQVPRCGATVLLSDSSLNFHVEGRLLDSGSSVNLCSEATVERARTADPGIRIYSLDSPILLVSTLGTPLCGVSQGISLTMSVTASHYAMPRLVCHPIRHREPTLARLPPERRLLQTPPPRGGPRRRPVPIPRLHTPPQHAPGSCPAPHPVIDALMGLQPPPRPPRPCPVPRPARSGRPHQRPPGPPRWPAARARARRPLRPPTVDTQKCPATRKRRPPRRRVRQLVHFCDTDFASPGFPPAGTAAHRATTLWSNIPSSASSTPRGTP